MCQGCVFTVQALKIQCHFSRNMMVLLVASEINSQALKKFSNFEKALKVLVMMVELFHATFRVHLSSQTLRGQIGGKNVSRVLQLWSSQSNFASVLSPYLSLKSLIR